MGGMMAGMGFLWLFWAVLGLLLIVLAVLAIVWLVRSLNGQRVTGCDGAEQVLRREYASGRIDQDEYERRRAHLAS
jgi:uncharacterized membrane protein